MNRLWSSPLLLLLLLLLLPAAAQADPLTCATDADCPYAMSCTEVKEPCPGVPTCVPCACTCAADADCPPCDCPPCDKPPPCTPESKKRCRYEPAECSTTADCLPGFKCEEEKSCSGSGGGSACLCPSTACTCPPCAPGETCPPCECPDAAGCSCPDPGPPSEPTCEVTGHGCWPEEQACAADADCPKDWTCVEDSESCACTGCACATPACGPDGDCPDAGPCDCPPCECPESGKKLCVPPGWKEALEKDPAVFGEGSGGPRGTLPGPKDNTEIGTGGSTDAASAAPQASSSTGGSAGGGSSGGCAAGSAPAPWSLLLLSLLAVSAAWLRRRRVRV